MPPERRVLLWMCVLIAVNQLGFGAIIPSLPLYAQAFGVSASAVGLTIAIYGLARFFAAPSSGQLADRLGRRPTLALGGLLSAAGNLGCALATDYPEFLLARFLAGVGAGIVVSTGQIVLADITTPERRGRAIAIYQSVFLFAVGIGPLPGGLIASKWGLAAPFWAYVVAGLAVSLLAWFAVQETRGLGHARRAETEPVQLPYRRQVGLLLRQTGFALVSLISLMQAFARTGGLFHLIPLLGSVGLGLSVSEIGLALALGSVAGILAAYPAGMLTDYFGRKAVIVPATLIAGVAYLLFCMVGSFTGFAVAAIVWGIASSVGGAAPAAYAADSAPPGMNAAAMSSYRMVADLGYVIGPVALGFIADVGSPEIALAIAAIALILAGLVFAARAPETYRGRA